MALAQDGPAQPTTTHFEPTEFSFTGEFECNPGEEVTITGTSTGFITEVVTPDGDYMYTFQNRQIGTGTGVNAEGTIVSDYRFNQTNTDRFISEDPAGEATVFTGTFSFMLNNLDGGDNLVIRGLFHVTDPLGAPVVEFGGFETYCRG
jgi:hypothetical protein